MSSITEIRNAKRYACFVSYFTMKSWILFLNKARTIVVTMDMTIAIRPNDEFSVHTIVLVHLFHLGISKSETIVPLNTWHYVRSEWIVKETSLKLKRGALTIANIYSLSRDEDFKCQGPTSISVQMEDWALEQYLNMYRNKLDAWKERLMRRRCGLPISSRLCRQNQGAHW